MANVYVWSGAVGTGTGASWANACTTLTAAVVGRAAGDVYYVAHDHAQTQATSLTVTFPGSGPLPARLYCVNRAGSVPPVTADLRTTATITTTSNSNITLQGWMEVNGLNFIAGSGGTSAGSIFLVSANESHRYTNCSMQLATTSTTAAINVNSLQGANCIFENTTVKFLNPSQRMTGTGSFVWRDTADVLMSGSATPSYLIKTSTGFLYLEGLGLADMNVGLLEWGVGACTTAVIKDCVINNSALIHSSITGGSRGSLDVTLIRCDAGDVNYRSERYMLGGVVSNNITVVRSGGASDGTTPVSTKLVTGTVASEPFPLDTLPISWWNNNIGSPMTVALQILSPGGAPTNADIWMEVEYLGTSGNPRGSIASSGKPRLTAASTYPAGSGTWSAPGSDVDRYVMTTSFTPQEKGPITITVRAAKVSSTFYVDPKPLIS